MEIFQGPFQYFLVVPERRERFLASLLQIRHHYPVRVVCRSALQAVELAVALRDRGFSASAYCGHMPPTLKASLLGRTEQGLVEVIVLTFASLEEGAFEELDTIYYDPPKEIPSCGVALIPPDRMADYRGKAPMGLGAVVRELSRRCGHNLCHLGYGAMGEALRRTPQRVVGISPERAARMGRRMNYLGLAS